MPIPENYSSPNRMSAKERAFNQIQHWIIDGTLEPGEKLYDSEIAKALGISRTPTREALQLLEVQGFVQMHPGKDTRVTMINQNDVLKIYPPLAALQALAAEEMINTITPEDIETLEKINKQYQKAIDQNQPYKAMEFDEEFHNFIVEQSNNTYISHFCSTLQLHIRRFKYLFLNKEHQIKQESIMEHDELIQAFINQDQQKAHIIMKKNWLRPMNEVYDLLSAE